jgi:hypothetical protein
LATQGGPLGKLQFSSALALTEPAKRPAARAELLALAEERFLHQIDGRTGTGLVHAEDLPELERAPGEGKEPWLACDEWRCHFHVPVDLARMSELGTTREHADQLLSLLLGAPERWPTRELHVEIETYTWDVLPRAARGPGELVEGLAREYGHVLRLLEARGWRRA